jgi:hypothetical protein
MLQHTVTLSLDGAKPPFPFATQCEVVFLKSKEKPKFDNVGWFIRNKADAWHCIQLACLSCPLGAYH